jgi:glutamine---fructose-6-phosphate transaminase (isomerizing)
MCGIVGVIGEKAAAPVILGGLHRVAYRGYDSAGIATLVDGRIERRRAPGKLAELEGLLGRFPLLGTIGIGHTRWATHGAPTEVNAHPHGTALVCVVHNGIIENHIELRAELESAGQEFTTDTDTETIAQLLDLHLRHGMHPVKAAQAALRALEGASALAMIFSGYPDLMIVAQHGAPLAIGFGDGEMFVGSDGLALAPLTQRIAYLGFGDWAVMDRHGARFFDINGRPIECEPKLSRLTGAVIGKGVFRHHMEKELHEHPTVIDSTLARLLDPAARSVALPSLGVDLAQVPRITITACGSAYYAGLVGRWWFETYARVPTDIDVASEFRYRMPPLPPGGLGLLVSQSGETADTLAALSYLRQQGHRVVSIVNVPESTMARESDVVLETMAGPEMSVASTKAFTAQLTVLACLALAAGRARGAITAEREAELLAALRDLPRLAQQVLDQDGAILALARRIAQARDVLYLGRGGCFPIALEGALKLKEISYLHAEGYAAGEMKHGPIALIDDKVPIIAISPSGPLFEKTASNLQEAAARRGQVVVLSDAAGACKLNCIAAETIVLPTVDPFVAPILHAIPVQVLAYHVAVLKGTDVDQPRNLAKSVTVE